MSSQQWSTPQQQSFTFNTPQTTQTPDQSTFSFNTSFSSQQPTQHQNQFNTSSEQPTQPTQPTQDATSFQFSWLPPGASTPAPIQPQSAQSSHFQTPQPTATPQRPAVAQYSNFPTSDTSKINLLSNVTNARIQHLAISHERTSQLIDQHKEELTHLITEQEKYELQKQALQQQNVHLFAQFDPTVASQQYHLSSATITSHPEYLYKQQEVLRENQQLLQVKEQQSRLRLDYIKDLHRQLEELQAQHQLELQRIQLEIQRDNQLKFDQMQQQLEAAKQQQATQLQQQHQQHQQQVQQQQQQQQQQAQAAVLSPFRQQPVSHAYHTPNHQHKPHTAPSTSSSISPASSRSPSTTLSEQQQTFGLDVKIMHFYTFQYILFNTFSLYSNTPTLSADLHYLLIVFGIWSYQANHTQDFPILIFNRLPKVIEDWERKSDDSEEKMSKQQPNFLKLAIESTLPTSNINNNYAAFCDIVDFLVNFNTQHPLAHYIKPYLTQSTLTLITTIQQSFNIPAIKHSLESTLSPNANKLSKLYMSICQAVARFGGLVACQSKSQPPSALPKFHPAYIIFSITKFYHELLDSTSDHYLIGMVFAFLASISPLFHYIYLGNLLHSHTHSRSVPPSSTTELATQPIYFLQQARNCTLPSCACMYRSIKQPFIDAINSRVGLISAYSQSIISKSDPQLIVNDQNVFSLSLGTLRRKVDHPTTTMNELGTFMTNLHVDFTTFTSNFAKKVAELKALPPTSPLARYIPLITNSTWEKCSCCGYNGIPPGAQHAEQTDPQWQYSDLINTPVTTTIMKPLTDKALAGDTEILKQRFAYPVLYPFSSFNQYHPTSLPQELLSPSLINKSVPTVIVGNKLRITFLWGYFAQLINAQITPAYIHALLRILQIAASQFRFTYGQTGHNVLEFIFNDILGKQKMQLLHDPKNPQRSINETEYGLILADYKIYHDGDYENGAQPNSIYPFNQEDKKITYYQTSEVKYEALDASGNNQE